MRIYKIAKIYNEEIMSHSDYIGFHCQKRPRSEYDDIILNSNEYAERYYLHILNTLPFTLIDKARDMGLMDMPDKYSDEFDEWAENVHDFLESHNIRWIYVSQTNPLSEQYGDYRYYVLLPESCILDVMDDPHVNDIAYAYIYDGNIGSPNCIYLEEEEDGYEDI